MKKLKVGTYKLENGLFQISYKDSFDKRRRLKFKTLKEAKDYSRELAANANQAKIIGSDQPISFYIEQYLKETPESFMTKRSPYVFESFIKHFGRMQLKDVNKLLLSQWLEKIKEDKNYSSRTMFQCKYMFTPFFKYLFKKGLIDKDHLAEVKIKKGTRVKERIFLSETHIKTILEKLKELSPDLTYPVTYFLVHTGCKIGEALKLKWSQLDFQKDTVHFESSGSADERTIRLSVNLLDFLKTWPKKSDFVFLDEKNIPWTSTKYTKRISRDRAHVNLERHWDSFSFRNSFAYHFLRKGGTLPQLQVLLGHRGISDTIAAFGNIVSKAEEKTSPYELNA